MLLTALLDPSRVALNRTVSSKKNVLQCLAELFADDSLGLTPNAVFDSLIAREKLGSTGLGNGVAIPHARMKGIDQAYAGLLIAEAPVDFDAMDNAPVDLFFALIVPDQAHEEHLQILAELANLLANDRFTSRLRRVYTTTRALELVTDEISS